jgi:hypothetical protein
LFLAELVPIHRETQRMQRFRELVARKGAKNAKRCFAQGVSRRDTEDTKLFVSRGPDSSGGAENAEVSELVARKGAKNAKLWVREEKSFAQNLSRFIGR